MRMIWNGAALAAILALVAVAALNVGVPALASIKAAPVAAKTPGGKFADRLPSTLPAFR